MRSSFFSAVAMLLVCVAAGAEAYRLAEPGYHFQFPRDHFNHPDFQTEWWYYTGNLHSADGHRFGFELTFFRQGVHRETHATEPQPMNPQAVNPWAVDDVWMAHLALSDIDGGRFLHDERLNRSGAGNAGSDLESARVWNGNWSAHWQLDSKAPGGVVSQKVAAVDDRFSFELFMKSEKPPVIHGNNGISQKSEGAGHASHYVSFTRLMTNGVITVEGKPYSVEGLSWMDHEFFTQQLAPDQTGWDWLSLQLDDGSDLMLFRLRRKDGSIDPYSAGTYVDRQGRATHLASSDFSFAPGKPAGKIWTSPETGARYPIEWTIRVPSLAFEGIVSTRLPQQELTGKSRTSPAYWEGAVEMNGSRSGKPLKAAGYLEMTGYAGAVRFGE
jgi:predicted secreted hydrolase